MLVYIRKSELKNILCSVSEADIPAALVERLSEERRVEMARRKEKAEAHLYMTIRSVSVTGLEVNDELTHVLFQGTAGGQLFGSSG